MSVNRRMLHNGEFVQNCLILGSGRSGTSMVAGTLAKSGYYMGNNLYPAREGNPKGFFEAPEINSINEDLIGQVVKKRPPLFLAKWFLRDRPRRGQLWLAHIPVSTNIPTPLSVKERIEEAVEEQPYCFKDPRFSYTLPAWRPFLKNVVFICVFRDPATTAASILKECRNADYLHDLKITFEQALNVWTLMYKHILEIHCHEGDWLFLHYDQVLYGNGLDQIEILTGAKVDRSFPEGTLKRTRPSGLAIEESRSVYKELCNLAHTKPETFR